MTKELTTQNAGFPANMTAADMMNETGISSTDLMVPRLLLQQNTSEAVGEGKAKLGDVMHNLSGDIVASLEKPLHVLPLKKRETILVYGAGQDKSFRRIEEPTEANKKRCWTENFDETGAPEKWIHATSFIVLSKEDLAKGEAYPAEITFKGTSAGAGRTLASLMFHGLSMGRPAYSQYATISVVKDKKDTNYYAVMKVGKGEKANEEELKVAASWFNTLRSKKIVTEDAESDVPY